MRKLFVLLLALAMCITLLSGCGAKQMSLTHKDLTLCLPADYLDLSEAAYAGEYDFMYGIDSVIVSGLRDEKSLFQSHGMELTVETYGQLVLLTNDLEAELTQKDGIWTFSYESRDYTYVVTLWQTQSAFWTVQAYCPTENYAKASEQMWGIFKSITL